MPYTQADNLITPSDDQVVWRYMDLAKFIYLLEHSALYLSRLRCLKDPYEGFLPDWMVRRMLESGSENQDGVRNYLQTIKTARNWTYVSCWHMNPTESEAMWRLYVQGGQGIAVCSTIGRMKQALRQTEEATHIGRVHYHDYSNAHLPDSNVVSLAHCKRVSFNHENEVRLSIFDVSLASDGLDLSINLRDLIEKVCVGPQYGPWFADLVKQITLRYELDLPVHRSALDEVPLE